MLQTAGSYVKDFLRTWPTSVNAAGAAVNSISAMLCTWTADWPNRDRTRWAYPHTNALRALFHRLLRVLSGMSSWNLHRSPQCNYTGPCRARPASAVSGMTCHHATRVEESHAGCDSQKRLGVPRHLHHLLPVQMSPCPIYTHPAVALILVAFFR